MGKKNPPPEDKPAPPREADGRRPGEPARETPSDHVHDAGRPGGLPDLEKKTDTEEEHSR